MQNQSVRAELLARANSLPLCPGVYVMKDRLGKVIYVGKSRKLKNRVSQYFQNGEKNRKTQKMVDSVQTFDYYLCDNEMEALSLENSLIKEYTPKYNIRLKDAKSYPYIKLTDETYPRLRFTRKRESDKAKYFGPYSGVSTALSLMEMLSKSLGLPTCNRSFPKDFGTRPCIYYQMHQCLGVCTGKVTEEEYRAYPKMAADVLSGKSREVEKLLEEKMYRYSDTQQYEAAAKCRNSLQALQKISEKQKVVDDPSADRDVIALYSDDFCSAISVFYIRGGVLQDKADFLFGADSILEPEDMSAFLCEHYRQREFIPKEILLSFEMEQADLDLLSEYLSNLADRKIHLRTPEKGKLHQLAEMAEKNAAEKAKQYRADSEKQEGTLLHLAQILRLECYPVRVEAYDISNFGKENLTAGMVVAKEGKFSKSDYRSFKIKTVDGTDDYASMRETLQRRLSHLSDTNGSFSELPDLILLDGGKGHVSVIRDLLNEMNLEIPVFGMVKDDYHKTRALCTDCEEISIAKEQDVFSFVYRLQEEVHRYTVSVMEAAKGKSMKKSVLTKISGIGDAKAKKLLAAFCGIGKIKTASVEELAKVPTVSKKDAQHIFEYYRKNNGER